MARFYFKDIDGAVPDEFLVRSAMGSCACEADLDGSDAIDKQDVQDLVENLWGPCPSPCLPACEGDLNGDCVVDIDDFLEMLSQWGPCAAQDPQILKLVEAATRGDLGWGD